MQEGLTAETLHIPREGCQRDGWPIAAVDVVACWNVMSQVTIPALQTDVVHRPKAAPQKGSQTICSRWSQEWQKEMKTWTEILVGLLYAARHDDGWK